MKGAFAALVVALLASHASARDEEWPMLGHDALRSGGTATGINPPFERKWYRLFTDEGIQSGVQPVIAQGKVFLGTLGGVLHAIDSETGRDAWSYKASAPILHAAAVGSANVFFGTADGSIHAVRASDGNPVWRTKTGAAVWNAPAVHDRIVYIGSRDGRLYALNAADGKAVWTAQLGAPILNSPAVDSKSGRVYVGSEAMRVHAFGLADGREIWRSEPLPGSSMRGYHPVIAPDGSVIVTTAPVIGYDRFQELLLEMVRAVFGDFASWRHNKEENDRLRAENFRLMEKPETYLAQLEFIRNRLAADPQFQTFFALDPQTGKQRFVAPVVSSESMNGPAAPPLVTSDGRVIVKYQVLLRSRYEHYSPFLNVGYLDTRTGHIEPIMDQTRTYGWHDSLLLVHDEQCQLSLAGRTLLNTHQDNVNAMDLGTRNGFPQPFALNVHEPAPGEALGIRIAAWRGKTLPPGEEWLARGTAVYGGGSVLDVPVAIAGDSFYYLPTHELNSGCALIAYHSAPGTPPFKRVPMTAPQLTEEEWKTVQEMPWDWDTLGTSRLTNFLAALPGPISGSAAAPLMEAATRRVDSINDSELDQQIWEPAFDPAKPTRPEAANNTALVTSLRNAVAELLSASWRPLVTPAAKAPEHAYRFFNDPAETIYTLLLARPFLETDLKTSADACVSRMLAETLPRAYIPGQGRAREFYIVPAGNIRVADDPPRDELAQCYALWLWSRSEAAGDFAARHWSRLRARLETPAPGIDDDCGNGHMAGLVAYCRLAKGVGDQPALDRALPLARKAMRDRLKYEFAHTRGGVSRVLANGRSGLVRWRHLTPDVARLIRKYAAPVEQSLMTQYVDRLRPGWWIAWNVEPLMRNEAPCQLPSTPLEVFTARALILQEPQSTLQDFIDIPWCRADEFYIQKLALALGAARE